MIAASRTWTRQPGVDLGNRYPPLMPAPSLAAGRHAATRCDIGYCSPRRHSPGTSDSPRCFANVAMATCDPLTDRSSSRSSKKMVCE